MPATHQEASQTPLLDRTAPRQRASKTAKTLYAHQPHPHTPRNVNAQRAERHAQVSGFQKFNLRLAVALTKYVGTMQTAYVFAGIGIGSLVGVFTNNVFLAALFGSISSYFLQLVLLPVLSVGQNVLSEHAELQADEQFNATMRSLHGEEQMAKHLDAQDAELLRQTALIERMLALVASAVAPRAATTTTPAPITITSSNGTTTTRTTTSGASAPRQPRASRRARNAHDSKRRR